MEPEAMPPRVPRFAPEERFLDCVHCGLCLAACPTYVENGREADSPRGRIYLMKSLQDGTLPAGASTIRHLDLCLGCRACETACPSGVRYGTLIEGARAATEPLVRRPWTARVRRAVVARLLAEPRGQRWLARAARIIPRAALARAASIPWLPAGVRYHAALAASLPRPPLGRPAAEPALLAPPGPSRGTVALFPGCMAETLFPTTNRNAARLLVLAGFRVVIPPAPLCCGALLFHMGHRHKAIGLARETAAALRAEPIEAIAVTAAGCGAMLHEYGELLGEEGAEVAAKAKDVTVLLADAGLPAPPDPPPLRVAYHDACHLSHAQGVREAPRTLLRAVPGLELLELHDPDRCCGSAGTYNVTEPAMARRLMERKVADVLETRAPIVVAGNPGCLLQIRAGLAYAGARRTVEALAPVDLLARAHRL
jgi:glycolate oxidase iron-sulfur subunit